MPDGCLLRVPLEEDEVRKGLLVLAVCCGPVSGQVLGEGVREGLTSDDPATVLRSVEVYDRFAYRLELEDLRALSRSLRNRNAMRAAAPELQAVLERLGSVHPDPRIRARVLTRAPMLDTYARQVELRREIERLHGEGVTGVALWTAAAERAVELNLARGLGSNAEVMDATILDLGVAFNGSSLRGHLSTYDTLFGWAPGADPLLDAALEELGGRSSVLGFAGYALDHADEASDFRPDLHDGTQAQINHSSFFVNLAYVVGLHDPVTPHLANLKHETIDPGASMADFRASQVGIVVGLALRMHREADGDPRLIPTVIGAAFSETPEAYAFPQGPEGADLSDVVQVVEGVSQQVSDSPAGPGLGGRAISAAEEGIIRGLNVVRGDPQR